MAGHGQSFDPGPGGSRNVGEAIPEEPPVHHAADAPRYMTLDVAREGAVDWLTLNRPERLNAIDAAMTAELFDYFGRLHADPVCRVVLMRGAGRGFCSGLDLKSFDPSAPVGEAALPGVIRRMRSCPQPIVALIHGAASGGGFSLALACDVRLAAPDARMNAAYIKLGVSGCELGTSFHLPRLGGASVANELMLTGRFIGAERAAATALVSAVVPDGDLAQAGRDLAADMLEASAIGLRKTRETVERVGRLGDLDAAIDLEEAARRDCMRDPAFAARVTAFSRRG